MATGYFERMADSMYDSNWHEIPVRMQKYVVVMITNMQRLIQYHGFGIAVLNLETFCKVRNELKEFCL